MICRCYSLLLLLSLTLLLNNVDSFTIPKSSSLRCDTAAHSSIHQDDDVSMSRRNAVTTTTTAAFVTATGLLFGGSTKANAAEGSKSENNNNKKKVSPFEGTYTDPKHPGGKRDIKLISNRKIADYQLAMVMGGGGKGEPESYVLPAVICGDRQIIIDFSPKGGPKDLTGVLVDGGLKFLKDGNVWPKVG